MLIQEGKPPGSPLVLRIADLVKAGLIEVVTPDLTLSEVAKKHAENDYEVIKETGRSHFRKLVSQHIEAVLPEMSKSELKIRISNRFTKSVDSMFKDLKAKILPIDTVKPSTVFSAYSSGLGFFSADSKKDQFPDAFIFECLKACASAESPLIIVSNDGDFEAPVKSEKHISLLKTITSLFESLNLKVEAPNVQDFLKNQQSTLIDLCDEELNDWGLQVSDVEDAEIDATTVTNVELNDVISFGSITTAGSILVVGAAEIRATVSYTHPNWDEALYDSEDGVLIPFDDVSGETEVTVNPDFSMYIEVDANGSPVTITELQFSSSDFIFVELNGYDADR